MQWRNPWIKRGASSFPHQALMVNARPVLFAVLVPLRDSPIILAIAVCLQLNLGEIHMRKIATIGAVLVAAGLASAPAYASTVIENYSFSLGGFVDVDNGSPPPVSTVSGSFTVTFDPTQNYDNDTTDLVMHSFNIGGITLGSPLGFTYMATGTYAGDFWLGGTQNDADTAFSGTNDFVMTLNMSNLSSPQLIPCSGLFSCGDQTGNPAYETTGYTTSGNTSIWLVATRDSIITSGVPEPTTWAMFLVGFGAVGFAMRRPLRKVVVPFS